MHICLYERVYTSACVYVMGRMHMCMPVHVCMCNVFHRQQYTYI